ncbi:MAG: MarR family winged helix-turn-helix transcriptional regulator [Candidatus Puniceispirillales bacterium WSBS_2018_MAG_OTU23]
MTDIKTSVNPLFLREDDLRHSIELLFFAYRDFTGEADAILAKRGLGRAHHRVIYFVGRNPAIMVSELLAILNITKQSLSRVLSRLISEDYINVALGTDDKRQRLLSLTGKGSKLEGELTNVQKMRFSRAYKKAGFENVDGFLKILEQMQDAPTDKRDG